MTLCPRRNPLDMFLPPLLCGYRTFVWHLTLFLTCGFSERTEIWESSSTDLEPVSWRSFWSPGSVWKGCRCLIFLSVSGAVAEDPDGSQDPRKPENDCSAVLKEPRPTCDSARTRNKAARSPSERTTHQTPNEKANKRSWGFGQMGGNRESFRCLSLNL